MSKLSSVLLGEPYERLPCRRAEGQRRPGLVLAVPDENTTGQVATVTGLPSAGKAAQHTAIPELWICRVDAYPWPCADARLNLLADFHGRTLALNLYLAPLFVEALADLSAIDAHPDGPPDPRAIFDRFMGWIPTRRHR